MPPADQLYSDWQLRLQDELRPILQRYKKGGVGLTAAQVFDALTLLAQELQDEAANEDNDDNG